jgi:hypothetical protein
MSISLSESGAVPVAAATAGARATPPGEADLADRWRALNEAGGVVAMLAGREAEAADPAMAAFPQAMARVGGQRLAIARRGLDDLSAMLETGIRALLTVHARGANARPPAQALWREFADARRALLVLVPPEPRMLG